MARRVFLAIARIRREARDSLCASVIEHHEVHEKQKAASCSLRDPSYPTQFPYRILQGADSRGRALLPSNFQDFNSCMMADDLEAGNGTAEDPEVHVLAVDDSLVDRKMIEKLLTTSACRVTAVDSGQRALEFLESLQSVSMEAIKVNLVVTDYCMPGMTGYDLLKRIKGTCFLKEIPVVIVSSENVPNRVKRCLAEGAEDFLLKPLQPADMKRLREHVRSCMGDSTRLL